MNPYRPLSPTLARVAGCTAGPRSGFSLIELMAALALSVVIMLMVASAYRLVAQAVSQVNIWSTENQQLRTGFVQALDDADFWHSYADADAPYEKDFQRERTDSANNTRKRPFQPLRFAAATAADHASNAPGLVDHQGLLLNPNVFLPHDPRSWYRHRLLPSARPKGVNDDGTGGRDWGGPGGWRPSHIYGDYGLTAATDMVATQADPLVDGQTTALLRFPALLGIDPLLHQARPRAMWEVYQYLGMIGVAEYMPPDCPWLMFGPDGRMPHPASAPAADFCSVIPPIDPTAHGEFNYVGHLERSGWAQAGAADWTSRLGASFVSSSSQSAFTMQPFPGEWAGEFDGDMRNADSWINGTVGGGGARMMVLNYHGTGENAVATAHSNDFLTSTVRVPYNLTDALRPSWRDGATWKPFQTTLDYTSKPKRIPALSTSTMRFHEFGGGNLAVHWVRVESPESGKVIELGFTTTTTTWRGARQHWRLDPRWPTAASAAAIGDYYE